MWVSDEPGEAMTPSVGARGGVRSAEATAVRTGGPAVLLLEGHEQVRDLVAAMLTTRGLAFDTASCIAVGPDRNSIPKSCGRFWRRRCLPGESGARPRVLRMGCLKSMASKEEPRSCQR